MLGLLNPNSMNWTLVVSSSDSASTQKRIIKECRQNDEEKFGSATVETIGLIETFCSMHLGVTLRKAFLSGTMMRLRSLVKGNTIEWIPWYMSFVNCSGELVFQNMLQVYFPSQILLKASTSDDDERAYYQTCSKVRLHRQVGSRYFATDANACKIVFLKDAAIQFLKFTGRD